MERTFEIPEFCYEGDEPYRTHYMDEDAEGLAYKLTGERAFERAAAFGGRVDSQWTVISLRSPYITGDIDGPWSAPNTELVSVDVEARKVTLREVL